MTFEFDILGPVEVRRHHRPVTLGTPKRRVLLAALLLRPNTAVTIGHLVETIWGDRPPDSAVANLRTYAATLRSALLDADTDESRLVTSRRSYLVRVEPGELDADRFDTAVTRGRKALARDDAAEAVDALGAALGLWRGPAGDGLAVAGATALGLNALNEQRISVAEDFAQALSLAGDPAAAEKVLRPLVAEHPLRERAWEYLMLAAYRLGDVAGALAAYSAAREALVQGLGIDPSEDLQRLHQAILRRDASLDAPPAPRTAAVLAAPPGGPPSVPGGPPRQLPPAPGVFVGRAGECATVLDVLSDGERPAVAAIHGPPGVGKSALAVAAAHEIAAQFPDGQLYLDLQGGAAPGLAPVEPLAALRRFLVSLGATDGSAMELADAQAQYRTVLAGRRVLVVLDNAVDEEHVRPLIPPAPGCAALLTSRRMLVALDIAHHVALDALTDDDAVTLLARFAGPDRAGAEPAEAARIARLCDNLPLALRIAGARLAARPSRSLGSLARRLAADRQRLDELRISDLSLRSCFQSCYREVEQRPGAAGRVFRLLGLLPVGEFGAPVVAAVADLPVHQAEACLEELADARLVEPVAEDRFRSHDLLRLFAAELAVQQEPAAVQEAAAQRGFDWYLSAVRHAVSVFRPSSWPDGRPLPGPDGLALVAEADAVWWLEAERPNLLTLAHHAAGSPASRSFTVRLAKVMASYLPYRLEWHDFETLCRLALRATDADGDDSAVAWSMTRLGMIDVETGRAAGGLPLLHRALAVYRAAGDRHGESRVLGRIAVAHVRLDDAERALTYFRDALDLQQREGDLAAQSRTLSNAAEALYVLGRHRECVEYLRRSLDLRRRLGDLLGEGVTRNNLGEVLMRLGEIDRAVAETLRGWEIGRAVGNRFGEREALRNLVGMYRAAGNDTLADDAVRRLDELERAMAAASAAPPG